MNEYEKMCTLLMSVRGTPAFPIVLKEAFDGLIMADDLHFPGKALPFWRLGAQESQLKQLRNAGVPGAGAEYGQAGLLEYLIHYQGEA